MNNAMDKHERFILDTLLSAVIGHARRIGVGSDEAALASFLRLGPILQAKGFTADRLMAAIKASTLHTHDASGRLQ